MRLFGYRSRVDVVANKVAHAFVGVVGPHNMLDEVVTAPALSHRMGRHADHQLRVESKIKRLRLRHSRIVATSIAPVKHIRHLAPLYKHNVNTLDYNVKA